MMCSPLLAVSRASKESWPAPPFRLLQSVHGVAKIPYLEVRIRSQIQVARHPDDLCLGWTREPRLPQRRTRKRTHFRPEDAHQLAVGACSCAFSGEQA